MTKEPDLTLPHFLKAPRKKRQRKVVEPQWVMPKKKESRQDRRQRKADHDRLVTAAVKEGCDTFHKIRKELDNGENVLRSNDISNAIRRSIKSRSIEKVGRRYYPFGH